VSNAGLRTHPRHVFCAQHGALDGGPRVAPSATDVRPWRETAGGDTQLGAQAEGSIDGERRHLGLLFCDSVNSEEITAHLGTGDWGEIAIDYPRSG